MYRIFIPGLWYSLPDRFAVCYVQLYCHMHITINYEDNYWTNTNSVYVADTCSHTPYGADVTNTIVIQDTCNHNPHVFHNKIM